MQDTRLYTIGIPGSARTRAGQSNQQRVAANASLSSQGSGARSLGSEPGSRDIDVQYKGYNSEVMARMLIELAKNANGFEVVPWFAVDENGESVPSELNAWYAVERAEQTGSNPRVPEPSTVSLSLKETGTTKTVWRRLSVQRTVANVEGIIDDPGTDSFVAISSSSSTVRWFDGESETAAASPTSSSNREFGRIQYYDLETAPFDADSLIYQVPYNITGLNDLKVWDTRGFDRKTQVVNGTRAVEWMKVFAPDHEFEDRAIIDNGRTRVHLDEATGEFRVDLLDLGNSDWLEQANNSQTDWQVSDVDLTYVGPSRVTAYVIWSDGPYGATYPLWLTIRRGHQRPHWYRPQSRAAEMEAVPTELGDLVSVWANDSTFSVATQCGVIERQEVR